VEETLESVEAPRQGSYPTIGAGTTALAPATVGLAAVGEAFAAALNGEMAPASSVATATTVFVGEATLAEALTATPVRSVEAPVFLSELNDLQLCACNIGNAYLEAKTREKLCIIAGPEFGELEGHSLVMFKACHGARTSGNCFTEKLADGLRDRGFFQS